MTKLYQKSEITFAILWIVAYVVLSSYADQLSLSICIVKSVTAVLQIVMSLILFFWIRSNNLSEKPLVIIASTAFWGGFGLQYGFPDTLMYVISMCCVYQLTDIDTKPYIFAPPGVQGVHEGGAYSQMKACRSILSMNVE